MALIQTLSSLTNSKLYKVLCTTICMKYESLWDSFTITDKEYPKEARNMKYRGTLDGVLKETEKIITSKNSAYHSVIKNIPGVHRYLDNRMHKNNLSLALHASRIIRSSMEHKIANEGSGDSEEILKRSIGLGLNIYRDPKSSLGELENFRSYINQSKDGKILQKGLIQDMDRKSWKASNPKLSFGSAKHLHDLTNGNNVLFLALGNGGIAPGMDVYLRYCDYLDDPNSDFYVARFSKTKKQDIAPQLTDAEKKHIQVLSQGKQIVLFDEDVNTRKTMEEAKIYFEETFNKPVKALANFSYSEDYINFCYSGRYLS